MSNNTISKLQILDPKYWSGLTRQEHLAAIGGKSPQYIDQRMEKIYEINYGSENIVSFMNKFPIQTIDDPEEPYRWRLEGVEERNIPLVKASLSSTGNQVSASDKAGLGLGVFYMWFPERYFDVTTHIVGENPESFQLRIIEEPVADGTLWRYKVQNFTGDNANFVPYEDLVADTRWKELYGMVEGTLSKRGNGVHHSSHFEMENRISMIRKNVEVPGNMIGAKNPVYGMQYMDGKEKKNAWINKLDWDFFKQFRADKARLLMYGKSNKLSDGTYGHKGESGNTIKAGYGLYEQMASGNVMYYNKFSLKMLTDFALQLCVGKLAEDSRKFLLSTGEYGAAQFHEAAQEKAGSYTGWLRSDHNFKDGGKTLDESQIKKYVFVNGIEFYIMVDPTKDNPVLHTKKFGKGLAQSFTYDIWDIGTSGGESNIKRVVPKDAQEVFRYIPGLRDPFTPGGTGYNGDSGQAVMTASSTDGYSMYKAAWFGVMIRNIKRTGRLIPNVLA